MLHSYPSYDCLDCYLREVCVAWSTSNPFAFAILVCADVMYIREAIPALVATLVAVSDKHTTVLLAHGRNRGGEETFLKLAAQHFCVQELIGLDLDEVYQCVDVTVYCLKLL